MNTEELRKKLSQLSTNKRFYSGSQLSAILNSAVKNVKNGRKASFEDTEAGRWLNDNFDFVLSVSKSIDVKRSLLRRVFGDFLLQAVLAEDFSGSKEDVQMILSEAEKNFSFKEEELDSVREAFFISSLRAIAFAISENPSMIPRLIRSLHQMNGLDFHRIALSFSPLERILRSDPAGIYTKMTGETRSLYRERIKKEAAHKKMSREAYANTILQRAMKDKKHIGFCLQKKKHVRFYFLPIFIVSSVVSVLLFLYTESLWFALFIFPMLYFSVKSIADGKCTVIGYDNGENRFLFHSKSVFKRNR